MQREFSLKIKLILAFWLILVFTLAVPSNYFIQTVEEEVNREHLEYVRERLDVIHWIISKENESSARDLQALLQELEFLGEDRVEVLDKNGNIIADSGLGREEQGDLKNLGSSPEIIEARENGTGYSLRYSDVAERKKIYLARQVEWAGYSRAAYLRLSTPYAGMESFFQRISSSLWQFVFLSLFLSCVVVYLLVSYLTYRLRPMVETAQSIGKGNFQQRIQVSPGKEFDPLVEAINRMARDIEASMDQVSAQKSNLETILHGIRDGLAALDHQGRIMNFNRSFQNIFGHLNQISGKRPVEVFFDNQLQETCNRVLSTPGEQTSTMELCIQGRYYDVHVVSPPERSPIKAVILLHDITKLKHLESIRKDFVANASHQLRTPLTSIKGYSETLLQNHEVWEKKGLTILEVIDKNADHMIRLLDDILQLSRIESLDTRVDLETVELSAVAFKAWEGCKHYARDKELAFEFSGGEQEQVFVLGEPEYLVQVFQNLLENSIKFSPQKGTIKVLVRSEGDMVWTGVQDQGPGIPKEEQARIFERFYRVKKDKNKVKGTGLGLAICNNIVKMLGGEVWVESPVAGMDHGCIIWMSLHKPG